MTGTKDHRLAPRRAPSVQTYARMAGILFLISLVAGGFGEYYVPSKLIVPADAAALFAVVELFYFAVSLILGNADCLKTFSPDSSEWPRAAVARFVWTWSWNIYGVLRSRFHSAWVFDLPVGIPPKVCGLYLGPWWGRVCNEQLRYRPCLRTASANDYRGFVADLVVPR